MLGLCINRRVYRSGSARSYVGMVLTVLLLSILIIIIINIIALINSFIKDIISQSDVKRYQLHTWLSCLSGNDFQNFIAS